MRDGERKEVKVDPPERAGRALNLRELPAVETPSRKPEGGPQKRGKREVVNGAGTLPIDMRRGQKRRLQDHGGRTKKRPK